MQSLHAACVRVRASVIAAREAGFSWSTIAHQLGIGPAATVAGMSLQRAAWRVAAAGVFPGQADPPGITDAAADYRCQDCGATIVERDPDAYDTGFIHDCREIGGTDWHRYGRT
jgi:hypothetical protein